MDCSCGGWRNHVVGESRGCGEALGAQKRSVQHSTAKRQRLQMKFEGTNDVIICRTSLQSASGEERAKLI